VETLAYKMKAITLVFGRMLSKGDTPPSEIPEKYREFKKSNDYIIGRAIAKRCSPDRLAKYKQNIAKVL